MKGFSLRYKLMAALTVVPVIGLSLFLWQAATIFTEDKIPSIYDSSLQLSKTRAARVSAEVSSLISIAQAIVLSYRNDTQNLAETGKYYFDSESRFQAFRIHAFNSDSGQYAKTVELAKQEGQSAIQGNEPYFEEMVRLARDQGIVVRPSSVPDMLWLAARFGQVTDPRHLVALTLFDAKDLSIVFNESGLKRSFLIRKAAAEPIFASDSQWERKWGPADVWKKLSDRREPEGTLELLAPTKRLDLVSFVDIGVADLAVVALEDKAEALRAVETLRRKSLLFFIAILSATTIFAVIAARGLTSALRRLSEATQKVAEGNFDVRVDARAGGEIGLLARGFNTMAEEVSRLMKETAEKARMESELATAKTVQETLFPEAHAEIGSIQITGHYVPASECGGDWWYYFENEDKVYIWIGDATGHGAPAALLTSAARAVASVIHFGPPLPVSDALGILNRAICETSKGRMMMTFFLASIDKKTGVMSYANASHEPPLLLHASDSEPSRDDFIPLNEVNNPRLGEQADCVFKEYQTQLQPGDRIVFYTDGVVDVKNPEKKAWGERRFLKSLSAELTSSQQTNEALIGVVSTLESFRSETPLDDDVTLILCSYKGAA